MEVQFFPEAGGYSLMVERMTVNHKVIGSSPIILVKS